jgi:ribosomal protein L40E
MYQLQQAETLSVKACRACSAALLERDRFCRLCGTRQPEPDAPLDDGRSTELRPQDSKRVQMATLPIEAEHFDIYRSVSGPLVKAVVAGVNANATSQLNNRFLRRAVLALVSLPIWLIILLLSPLDAYAAARSVCREV